MDTRTGSATLEREEADMQRLLCGAGFGGAAIKVSRDTTGLALIVEATKPG